MVLIAPSVLCLQPKKEYPRDFMQEGRVRVQLKREDGSLNNLDICSSKDVRTTSVLHCTGLQPVHAQCSLVMIFLFIIIGF